ncbi:MAG: CrcB family protein [Nocardioides sp.]|uniref:CrcB family protein n=1 Tax=Nocardioides sp. TaxID=35761 RepID=UPI002629CBA7|nr:CrcB family protein [Nocardioides sp.]
MSTLATAGLVALGAAVGAPLRYWLWRRWDAPGRPVGTLVANTAGSLLLGVLSGLALGGHLLALLGTGLAGALTTWSTLALQTHGLGRRAGSAYVTTTLVLALGACAVGFVAGSWLA